MKAQFQNLTREHIGASVHFTHVALPHFDVPWHYHPEIEIILVLRGEGRRFVGDHIDNFHEGDLCIVGDNLPHVWKNNDEYYQGDSSLVSECIVVHFKKETFGDHFWQLPEMSNAIKALKMAKKGVAFTGKTREKLTQLLIKGQQQSPEKRVLTFLQMLNIMGDTNKYKALSSLRFESGVQSADGERFQKAVRFISENYQRPILLEEISEKINMSPTTFCRYMKMRTGKSFLQYLNHYRIGFAKRLLIENKTKIQDIAFDCGFGNLSHFNHQFKKITGLTPREYKKEHMYS